MNRRRRFYRNVKRRRRIHHQEWNNTCLQVRAKYELEARENRNPTAALWQGKLYTAEESQWNLQGELEGAQTPVQDAKENDDGKIASSASRGQSGTSQHTQTVMKHRRMTEKEGDNMFLTVKTITDDVVTINVNTVEFIESGKVDNIKGSFIRFIDGTEKFIPIKKMTLVNLMLKANEAFYCNPDAEYYEDDDEEEDEEEENG